MSRKLHHGSNGSYKTSGALADDLMKAVESGRTIISNVRGLTSREKIIQAWYKLQPLKKKLYWKLFPNKLPFIHFELIHLDTECKDTGEANLEKLRRWMEWVPMGSLLIFDEIGEIYDPKEFNTKKLSEYNFPQVMDESGAILKTSKQASLDAGRWETLTIAFQKHRHFNLDFIFTTTDHSLFHPMIIKGSDMAYRHFNMGNISSLGKGRYKEIAHAPINNGSQDSHAISVETKTIPQPIFEIYESTSTGEVNDTIAGTGIWTSNAKLRYMTYFVVCCLGYSAYNAPQVFKAFGISNEEKEFTQETTQESKTVPIPKNNKITDKINFQNTEKQTNNKDNNIRDKSVIDQISTKRNFFINNIIGDHPVILLGRFSQDDLHFYVKNTNSKFTFKQIKRLGFSISFITPQVGFLESTDSIIAFRPRKQQIDDFCCLPDGQSIQKKNSGSSIGIPSLSGGSDDT